MSRIDHIFHHADESEKAIEAYLVKRCKEKGYKCLKYSSPSEVGYPDRLVLLPEGKVVWVELKSKGKKPRPIQTKRAEELWSMGHQVYCCDSRSSVDDLFTLLETPTLPCR